MTSFAKGDFKSFSLISGGGNGGTEAGDDDDAESRDDGDGAAPGGDDNVEAALSDPDVVMVEGPEKLSLGSDAGGSNKSCVLCHKGDSTQHHCKHCGAPVHNLCCQKLLEDHDGDIEGVFVCRACYEKRGI